MATSFGVQPFPLPRGQRRRAWLEPVSRIAMEIRAAGHEQFELTRHSCVSRDGARVMVGGVDLDGVETGFAERRKARVHLASPRVGQRGKTAGVMEDCNDILEWRARPFDERRTATTEPSIERLPRVGDVSGINHRARHLRTPDRLPRMTCGD